MVDSAIKIVYLGGDAADHAVDMRQLGTSLIGVDKIISDLVITVSAKRLPKRGERSQLKMKAREPIAGSVEIPAVLQDAAWLLPLGWSVLQTAAPDVLWNWIKSVIEYYGGDKDEATKHVDMILALIDRGNAARDRDADRHMQENREWRELLLRTLDHLQPAAAQAVAPVGVSVTQMRIETGSNHVVIDTPTADRIKLGDKLDVKAMAPIILRVEGFTFHNRKLSVEHPEQGGFFIADVQDPIFDEYDNAYTAAASRKARIRVQAKRGYRGNKLVKLYVMDFIEALDDAL